MPRNPTKPVRQPKMDVQMIAKALARSHNHGIDTGVLMTALIDVWGGTSKFARDIFEEFQIARPGGNSRQKILEFVTRLIVVTTNQSIARPRQPADLDDEDLDAVILDLNGRVVQLLDEEEANAARSAATATPSRTI